MNYVGIWKFHSIGTFGEESLEYMNAEEYLKAPMPYIDESDPEAVDDEIAERKKVIGTCIEICEDGNLYMLIPLPEGVSQEEIDEAIAEGMISLRNGMMCDSPMKWEDRNGEFWLDTAISGEVFGEAADTWAKTIDDNGYFNFMNIRFVKED